MHAETVKSESCSHLALQYFTRLHDIPKAIKSDNASTETGQKWTEHYRKHQIVQNITELYQP